MPKAKPFDRLYFPIDLRESELATVDLILLAEATVDTAIGADVREVKGKVELECLAVALNGQSVGFTSHHLKVGYRRWRDESHEVLCRAVGVRNSSLNILRRLVVNTPAESLKVIPPKEIICCSLHGTYFVSKRNEVKGEEASASIR